MTRTADQARHLARHDPVGFAALFVWPIVLGTGLVIYGITAPPGGLFGVFQQTRGVASPLPLVFIAAGTVSILTTPATSLLARSMSFAVVSIPTLGRCTTLLLVGSPEIAYPREVGSAVIFALVWIAAMLIMLLSTPANVTVRLALGKGPQCPSTN